MRTRATIQPTTKVHQYVQRARENIRTELTINPEIVQEGFATARSGEDLMLMASQAEAVAAQELIVAAYCYELLANRVKAAPDQPSHLYSSTPGCPLPAAPSVRWEESSIREEKSIDEVKIPVCMECKEDGRKQRVTHRMGAWMCPIHQDRGHVTTMTAPEFVNWEPVQTAPQSDTEFSVGETVTVALEGPGPGLRDPRGLRDVEGVITSVADDGLLTVAFVITEDNYDSWLALMPDQPITLGEEHLIPDVDPMWIVDHV